MGATQIDKPGDGSSSSEADGVVAEESADVTKPTLSEDDLFELLANRRRRYILHELMRKGEAVDIGSLSQEIAANEDGLEVHEVSSKDRKRVYTALHQSHLPKMDKTGVVSFDRDRGTVEPTQALEDVEIYMDVVRGRELPWSDYYLGLTALSAVFLAASTLAVGPFAALPLSAWGAFVVVSFGVFAFAHRYYARRNRLGIDRDPPEVEYSYAE
ncbi:DUF7344 domain-containing protein [Natrarchaeobaculum sulfurireducens]|uniref:DUF7344 domain-containing protein n=1 Tax=Natrarchaeobaculum sulfurireducens TaxID=2044521 RepID=A0A346PC68_9EURY|nr:DUF308 domain-containing protein [Natrarchaeobaculum sulfurireducens]AXR77113.1 hypothetical protein AArc1_0771 [Natrarchaeobaculum sulfurireducens]AXR82921.1 hypothetical protein AArcMg_2932 [Natrarchaeobaculum sulfurireducens]